MNLDNVKTWVAALRDPNNHQVRGALRRDAGHCCLGLGYELSGGTLNRISRYQELWTTPSGYSSLPPTTFHEWLGVRSRSGLTDDVYLDWPEDLPFREHEFVPDPQHVNLAGLNDDALLTFPQIADLIDYFGLRDTPVFS